MGGDNKTVCVNETSQVVNVTIHADKIEITHFDTHNNPVSIVINTTAAHLVILNYSKVSGTNITGFTFPEGSPSQSLDSVYGVGWFYIFFFYEGVDTEVSFEYRAWCDIHADNWVTVTEPEYFIALESGFILILIGLVSIVFTLYIHTRKSPT